MSQRASKIELTNPRLALASFFVLACLASPAHAQNRIDLDDLKIKGELLNDNRLRMSSREAQKITDRVNYRDNFRKEITDGLEVIWPEPEASVKAGDGGQP